MLGMFQFPFNQYRFDQWAPDVSLFVTIWSRNGGAAPYHARHEAYCIATFSNTLGQLGTMLHGDTVPRSKVASSGPTFTQLCWLERMFYPRFYPFHIIFYPVHIKILKADCLKPIIPTCNPQKTLPAVS